MDRGRHQNRILKEENALAAIRAINLKGGANMEKKEIIVLDPGIEDETTPDSWCCFYSFMPLIY